MSIFIDVILFSCNIITFEKLYFDCNIQNDTKFFYKDEIQINFNLIPELDSLEKITSLKCDGKIINIELVKEENVFKIKPKDFWKNGFTYQLVIDGSVKLLDGGRFDVFLQRDFVYGIKENQLVLTEYSNPQKNDSGLYESITFIFNQPIDNISFIDGFSISPFCDTRIVFSEDKTVVKVFPLEKWSRNIFYEWKLDEIYSFEKYIINKNYNGFFETCAASAIPELIQVCPIDEIDFNYVWNLESELDKIIRDKQCIGFIFSEPMDFESVSSAISFSPSIKGSLICLENYPNKFIWKPLNSWEIDTLYNLKVLDSACDLEGKKLFSSKEYFFTSFNQFLQVSNIDYTINSTDDVVTCNIDITFSSPVSIDSLIQTVESISFKPIFPLSISNPYLEEVKWNENRTIVSLQWSGFSKSSDETEYFYKLIISAGKNGAKNDVGEYLQEDVCEIVKM